MSIWAKSGLDGVYVYPFDCYDYSSTCGANKLKQSDLFNYLPCDCFLASSRFLLSRFPVGDTLLAKTLVLRVFHAAISFTVIGESLHNVNRMEWNILIEKEMKGSPRCFYTRPNYDKNKSECAVFSKLCFDHNLFDCTNWLECSRNWDKTSELKVFFKVIFYEESNWPVHCFQNLRSLEKPAVALHCKQLLSDGWIMNKQQI